MPEHEAVQGPSNAEQRPSEAGQPSLVYWNENINHLTTIKRSISTDRCVLILGPMFGLDSQQREIHEVVKAYLQNEGLTLDDEFQNLFIVEKKEEIDDHTIEDMIESGYNNIQPDGVYGNIAKLKFSAIVAFTQDTFLLQAFERFDCRFSYFASCKALPEFERFPKGDIDKVPFIYNVFGHYKHKDSLIYNYDKVYKFLFSILGESGNFPSELITKLANARVFILMGFDLKKWYVPIFITKLSKLGRDNNRENSKPTIIATINNTDATNLEYFKWLERHPLKLRFIENTYSFINELRLMADPSLFRLERNEEVILPPAPNLSETQREEFIDKIAEADSNETLIKILDELVTIYKSKGNTHASTHMNSLRFNLNRAVFAFHARDIAEDDYNLEINRTRNRIVHYINNPPQFI